MKWVVERLRPVLLVPVFSALRGIRVTPTPASSPQGSKCHLISKWLVAATFPNQLWEMEGWMGDGHLPIRSRKERLISKLAAQLKLLQKAKALPLIPAG